jgi:transcriptional regulator with XRE-family HTH domain
MEELAAYLDNTRMTQAKFAEAIGVKQPTVNRWLKKQARPSWDKAVKIQTFTEGAVTVSGWVSDFKKGSVA